MGAVGALGAGQYPPIADYGLIGDMHSCALVSRAGSIDWCCLPRFDSPSVFGRLLDWRRGGFFRLAPEGVRAVRRRYLPDTNVLETRFETDTGVAILTDLMPLPRTGPTPDHRPMLLRMLRCERGVVRATLECRPRFGYGAQPPRLHRLGERTGLAEGEGASLTLACSAPLEVDGEGWVAGGELRVGERLVTAVVPGSGAEAPPVDERALDALRDTEWFWRDWAAVSPYDGADRPAVTRSALTLKALTHVPTGAVIAAPTTSLPERVGGGLNWDYRFTWIRDATFTLQSLAALGYTTEERGFMRWLMHNSDAGQELRTLYGIDERSQTAEVELPHLEGYRRSPPVRTGNAAHSQFQLDIQGELLDWADGFEQRGGELTSEVWERLRAAVGVAADRWREPDEGIWEGRERREHHVLSKVMCWVTLDRGIAIASRLGLPGDLARWRRIREQIRDDVLRRGYDPGLDAFVGAYDRPELDASVLLLPLVGFLPADDPRMRSTIEAIERALTSGDGLVYRSFMHGPQGSEGTFAICSFWLADNLLLLGQRDRARRLLDHVMSFANDVGLLSEEIDPRTGDLLGNFPQAFSHLGHIGTAMRLHGGSGGQGVRGEQGTASR